MDDSNGNGMNLNERAILDGVAKAVGPKLAGRRILHESVIEQFPITNNVAAPEVVNNVQVEAAVVNVDMGPVAEALGGFASLLRAWGKVVSEQDRRHELAVNELTQAISRLPAPEVEVAAPVVNVGQPVVNVRPNVTANLDTGGLAETLDGFCDRLAIMLDGFLDRWVKAARQPQVVTIEHGDGTRSTVKKG